MKNALITGASSGIGLEFAKLHASKGGNCVLVARSKDTLAKIKEELEQKYQVAVYVFAIDLSKEGSCKAVYNFTRSLNLPIHILFNNAGFGHFGFFHETDWLRHQEMIQLNMAALTELTYLYLKDMIAQGGGYILQNASIGAFMPGPLMSVYYATKAYVLHFSEGLQNEVAPFNVKIITVCFGPIKSNFQEVAGLSNSKLLQGRTLPGSAEAAAYAYNAMLKGTPVAIHRFENKLIAFLVRLMPRSLMVKAIRKVQDKK
jgi:short-subunit dehydrogenase